MASLKVSYLNKVLAFLSHNSSRKYISFDDLCYGVGIYADALGPELSYFEPMILMDSTLNMRSLEEPIRKYLSELGQGKEKEEVPKRVVASNKELDQYSTIASFVYAKLAFAGGLVDPSAKLSDHDLHVLEKLVQREVKARKKKRPRKKK